MEQGLDFSLSPCPVSHAPRCSAQSLPPIAMAPGSCGATSRSARGRIQIFSNLGSRDSREDEREGMEGMEGMEEPPPPTHTISNLLVSWVPERGAPPSPHSHLALGRASVYQRRGVLPPRPSPFPSSSSGRWQPRLEHCRN